MAHQRIRRVRRRLVGGALRPLAALALALALLCAGMPVAAPAAGAAGATTTLTFDEVPRQPVNGLTVAGVTFGFWANGPSFDAYYNSYGPGTTNYVADPSLEGSAAGTLTLTFASPTTILRFGLVRSCLCTLTPGVSVALVGPGDVPIGTFTADTTPDLTYSEALFAHSGAAVARAVIAFPSSGTAPRFALDNLTFDTPPVLTGGSATYGGDTTLTAKVTHQGQPVPAGGAVTFTLDGQDYPATTDAQGVATATVPLPPGTLPGFYPEAVRASYAGDTGIPPAEGIGPLTVASPDCAARFSDVANFDPACPAIFDLSTAGIILGYATTPPTFGPYLRVQRAQIAAFLVRALDWQGSPTGPRTFTDFAGLVGELRDASLILANTCQNPADAATCVARGYGDGRFGPTDPVSYAQTISFIVRAFRLDPAYAWEAQPGQAIPYYGVPAAHELDIRTYHHYAGTIPDALYFAGYWDAPAPRAWVARVLWQALLTAP